MATASTTDAPPVDQPPTVTLPACSPELGNASATNPGDTFPPTAPDPDSAYEDMAVRGHDLTLRMDDSLPVAAENECLIHFSRGARHQKATESDGKRRLIMSVYLPVPELRGLGVSRGQKGDEDDFHFLIGPQSFVLVVSLACGDSLMKVQGIGDSHDLNIILDHDIFNDRDKDHIDILVSDENNINIIIHHDHDNIKDRNINNHFVRDQNNDDNLYKVNNVDLHHEYIGNFHKYFHYIHHQHLQQFNDLLEHHDIQYIHYIYEHNCNIHNNLVDEFDLHDVHLDVNYIHHDELHHIHNYHIQYDHNDDDHLPGTEELELRLLRFDSLPVAAALFLVGDNVTTSNASLVPAVDPPAAIDTSLQQYTHIMFFIESSFCEQTTPQVIPVLDAKASVSSVAFVDKDAAGTAMRYLCRDHCLSLLEDLDGWEIGGRISWTPHLVVYLLTEWYYRLYLADDDIGVNRALLNYK
ncbi:unnamed protein product, partial [Symbiodinium sp. CCMP2456]